VAVADAGVGAGKERAVRRNGTAAKLAQGVDHERGAQDLA
jgi:hypothetical protein